MIIGLTLLHEKREKRCDLRGAPEFVACRLSLLLFSYLLLAGAFDLVVHVSGQARESVVGRHLANNGLARR